MVKTNQWLKTVYWAVFWFAVFTGIGWLLGFVWQSLALLGLLYFLYSLRQQYQLSKWLGLQSKDLPPEASGLLGEIFDQLYLQQKRYDLKQQQLQNEVQYLRDSFRSLSEAVVMVDVNGLITWCNQSAQRFLGLRLQADEGLPLVNFLRDPAFIKYYDKREYDKTLTIHSPVENDTTLAVEITEFGPGHRIVFARDISQLVRLEQMRRDFVSNVSHELRTPLTVIIGYVDNFLALWQQDPKVSKPLLQMRQHASRMESLISDLLKLSRLETSGEDVEHRPVSLTELARRVAGEAQLVLAEGEQRSINLHIEQPVYILGHDTELHSALLNLVINACKYTKQNGKIDIRCYTNAQGAFFVVDDDGMGIEPLHIPRLTERFYRTDTSRSINTGGTGLGLAIVKRILLRHDAQLHITSQLGQGSSFSCAFPEHRICAEDKKTA